MISNGILAVLAPKWQTAPIYGISYAQGKALTTTMTTMTRMLTMYRKCRRSIGEDDDALHAHQEPQHQSRNRQQHAVAIFWTLRVMTLSNVVNDAVVTAAMKKRRSKSRGAHYGSVSRRFSLCPELRDKVFALPSNPHEIDTSEGAHCS